MLDPFKSDNAYSMAELTVAINKLPNNYGLINQLGLFVDRGVTTRTILVEEMNGILSLLPSVAPSGPATMGKIGKRKTRAFVIPHIPHDDVVLPEEVQGVRAFGSETGTETMANLMALKLQTMKDKHAITLEWMRMKALQGILIDGDTTTTLYNFYTEFSITPKTVDFALDDEDTNVLAKTLEVKRHIETNLKGEMMTGMRALVSPAFYDALTSHVNVEKAFAQYQALNQNLASDYRRGFNFGGIEWVEYNATASTPDDVSHDFITSGEGHVFPLGTSNTFRTFYAPADFNETVNTPGLPVYAKQEARKFGRGWDLHTQSNPLPICLRPEVLVKVTT